MPQIFTKTSNLLAKSSLIGLIVLAVLGLGLAAVVQSSPFETDVGIARAQPVPFSHKHHVGSLRLDCRHCHSAVEDSATAGMPTTETCMGCHAQIWKDAPMLEPVRQSFRDGTPIAWQRVNDLPDFVYFDHSVHLRSGVGCVSCHGKVESMPLTVKTAPLSMEWCLECHESPEKFLRPQSLITSSETFPAEEQTRIGTAVMKENHVERRTDCYVCHR